MVAIDIDGTLIDDNHNISKNTIDVIRELKERGREIALVTGRAHIGGKKIMDQIGIDLPIISHNGGKVALEDGKIITNEKLPISLVAKVLEYGEKNKNYMKIYVDDLFYVNVDDEATRRFSQDHDIDYKLVRHFSTEIIEDINLLILYYDREIDEKDLGMFSYLDLEITTSMPRVVEFIPKGVSKAFGLKELKKHLGIKRENILAIGNAFNDLSMLEFAGTGIAMKNSDILLLNNFKNVSQFSNNEEGVYRILRELL